MYFQRLRDLREDAGVNQTEIAELLHTTQSLYSKYELGRREIPVHHLITLANYYKTSIDFLVGRTNDKKWPR